MVSSILENYLEDNGGAVCWKDKKVKKRLRINRYLNDADRIIRSVTGSKSISLRSDFFMRYLMGTDVRRIMKRYVLGTQPFAAIRFGLYEYLLCLQYLEIVNGLRKTYSDFIIYHISMDAGMFSNDVRGMNEYARLILDNLKYADICACWRNYPEPLVWNGILPGAVQYIPVKAIYPYPFWNQQIPDWQEALRNKKVLVVSSFSKTIEKQYQKRTEIWGKDSDTILPEFTLLTFQAPQTSGGSRQGALENWMETFESMVNRILKKSFDIILISCGSYGLPLALKLKRYGCKAIQWGGCFQLWFGIMGNRWERDTSISPYRNTAWVYPDRGERPPLADKVNRCSYWEFLYTS